MLKKISEESKLGFECAQECNSTRLFHGARYEHDMVMAIASRQLLSTAPLSAAAAHTNLICSLALREVLLRSRLTSDSTTQSLDGRANV